MNTSSPQRQSNVNYPGLRMAGTRERVPRPVSASREGQGEGQGGSTAGRSGKQEAGSSETARQRDSETP